DPSPPAHGSATAYPLVARAALPPSQRQRLVPPALPADRPGTVTSHRVPGHTSTGRRRQMPQARPAMRIVFGSPSCARAYREVPARHYTRSSEVIGPEALAGHHNLLHSKNLANFTAMRSHELGASPVQVLVRRQAVRHTDDVSHIPPS